MWKILFVDDESRFHEIVKRDIIEKYFRIGMAEIIGTDFAFKQIDGAENANKLLEDRTFHLAFIDSYYENEEPVNIEGIEYKASILGEALIAKYKNKKFPQHYFFNTAYRDEYIEIENAYNAFNNDSKVTIVSKVNINRPDRQKDLIDKISDRLQDIAIKLSKEIDLNRRNELLIKAYNNNINSYEKVYINSEEWLIENLCAGWWDNNTKSFTEDLNLIIKKILTPDFTIAASECFGIDGYKQATHSCTQGYYMGDWFTNLLENLSKLSSFIKENGSNLDDELVKYKNAIDNFNKDLSTIVKLNEEGKKQEEVQRIINSREEYKVFRIGTSPNAKREFFIKEIKLERSYNLGGNEFEVYLPIDKIFESQFTFLISKALLLGCFSLKTKQKLQRNPITWVNGKQSILCKEYLIFYIENEFNNNFNPPDFITNFNSGKFEYFGKIYWYLCQDSVWNLLDMTYGKNNVTIDSISNELITIITHKQPEAKTFIIFEFLGWRQP